MELFLKDVNVLVKDVEVFVGVGVANATAAATGIRPKDEDRLPTSSGAAVASAGPDHPPRRAPPSADGRRAGMDGPGMRSVYHRDYRSDANDGGATHPYARLEKSKILQDARMFHDSILVRENPKQCRVILTQLLHLMDRREGGGARGGSSRLTRAEATDVFFGSTKLFVSNDSGLRRLVYVFIKEVQEMCDPGDVIIVTSCLTKDMTSGVGLYRANAIRVLAGIVDAGFLGAIERYVKQAIVDDDPAVSNAALVSAAHLLERDRESAAFVVRWIGEIQEAARRSLDLTVRQNALRLLCAMKARDRSGASRLVHQYGVGGQRHSPLALVTLIRTCGKLLREEHLPVSGGGGGDNVRNGSPLRKMGFGFLEMNLSHDVDAVSYEAARTICTLPGLEAYHLTPAVGTLQRMLLSNRPAAKFGAVRTLAEVAQTRPRVAAVCNEQLEAAVDDPNRNVATVAVTTLLVTGSEELVDRLLLNILSLFADMADEFKITVVKSLKRLCLRYPAKHRIVVAFLSNFLRDEGSFTFKQYLVNSIVSLTRRVPETADTSLFHLCEFIEDCEYTALSTQVVHAIAELAPNTPAPSRYIRYVYNRCILENAVARAAAISALAKFAARCPSLRPSIAVLLARCRRDEDDEARDRAAMAARILEVAMAANPYVPPPPPTHPDGGMFCVQDAAAPDEPVEGDAAACAFLDGLPMTFEVLAKSVEAYSAAPGAMESSEPITLSALLEAGGAVDDGDDASASLSDDGGAAKGGVDDGSSEIRTSGGGNYAGEKRPRDPAAAVRAIPELAQLGRIVSSSTPVALTEDETEYFVRCVKHVLDDQVILQFSIRNTVEGQRLENVTVGVESEDDDADRLYEVLGDVAAERICCGATDNCFAVLRRNVDETLVPVSFACQLHFIVVPIDLESGEPSGEGYQEEYQLESLEITTSDFMTKRAVPDFLRAWNSFPDDDEVLGKFSLHFEKLETAVVAVINLLGMLPSDGTGCPKPELGGARLQQHMAHLGGVFVGDNAVLARAQFTTSGNSDGIVLLKIAVRSCDKAISQAVVGCLS